MDNQRISRVLPINLQFNGFEGRKNPLIVMLASKAPVQHPPRDGRKNFQLVKGSASRMCAAALVCFLESIDQRGHAGRCAEVSEAKSRIGLSLRNVTGH